MDYSVVSLFSGGMGLDLGIEETDRFKLLACVEYEKIFCDTIQANVDAGAFRGNPLVIHSDISQLSCEEFTEISGIRPGDVDVLIGGPPCQSFSTAGRRKGVQDPRGTLLWDFLRFVEYLKPKFFLMENVRGLRSAALRHRPIKDRPEKGGAPLAEDELPGSVLRLFYDDLASIPGEKYRLDAFEVNSVNYGAPQIRERLLLIGNRFGEPVKFPAPTHGGPDEIKEEELFRTGSLEPWRTLGEAIGDLDSEHSEEVLDFSPRKKSFLELVPPGSNWRSLPIEIQQESMGKAWHAKGGRSGWWRRLSMDLPSPTLITMPNHASTSLCHPTRTRALTLREYARIQEFPDDWIFCGSTQLKYAQVGNAVPVRLGLTAGRVIADHLDTIRLRNWVGKNAYESEPNVTYIKAHVRTRRWFHKGEAVVWDSRKSNESAYYSAPKTLTRRQSLYGKK